MTEPLLNLQQIQINIGKKRVCDDLSLVVRRGEFWGILGPNGVGKTTFLRTIAGLNILEKGKILVKGQPIARYPPTELPHYLGYLSQVRVRGLPITVIEACLLACAREQCEHRSTITRFFDSQRRVEKAKNMLKTLELVELSSRMFNTLSGGESQRAALAMQLLQDPEMMLLDEPTNHMDVHQQYKILNLLRMYSRAKNKAILMVLHDINLAARFCDNLLLIFPGGENLQGDTHSVLTTQTLERLYHHPFARTELDGYPIFTPCNLEKDSLG